MKTISMPPGGVFLLECTTAPGYYLHPVKITRRGVSTYKLKKGVEGAAIYTKQNAERLIADLQLTNIKITPYQPKPNLQGNVIQLNQQTN